MQDTIETTWAKRALVAKQMGETSVNNKPFISGHKTFDKQVDTMLPFTRRAKTMYGWSIRPWYERNFGGTEYRAGVLQKLDLQPLEGIKDMLRSEWDFDWKMKRVRSKAKKHFQNHHGWVYFLFHRGKGGKKTGHGLLMTDHNGIFVTKIGCGPTIKSEAVLDEAINHLSIRPNYKIRHLGSKAYHVSYEFVDAYEIEATVDNGNGVKDTITEQVIMKRMVHDFGDEKVERIGVVDTYNQQQRATNPLPHSGKHAMEIGEAEWFHYPGPKTLKLVGLTENVDGPLKAEIEEKFGKTFKGRIEDALIDRGAKTFKWE